MLAKLLQQVLKRNQWSQLQLTEALGLREHELLQILFPNPLHLTDELAIRLVQGLTSEAAARESKTVSEASAKHPIVIGISGASCSGKSWMADKLHGHRPGDSQIIDLDGYYRELEAVRFLEHGHDNPESIHFEQAIRDLRQLKRGQPANLPVYCFETHKALGSRLCTPTAVIVMEGLFIFAWPELRELLDIKIWMETDQGLRLARRIDRDMTERERTLEEITERYRRDVVPGFNKFILPLRAHADFIVRNEGQDAEISPPSVQLVLTLLERAAS
jgi:uridine kinase